jgi:hypothetical protein
LEYKRAQNLRVRCPPHRPGYPQGDTVVFVGVFAIQNIEPVDEHVRVPEKEKYSSVMSLMSKLLILGIFLLAYGLYTERQIVSVEDFLKNLLPQDTSPRALLSSYFQSLFFNAAFIGAVFLGFGWLLGAPISRLLRNMRFGVYAATALLVLLWCVLRIPELPFGWQVLAVLTIGIWFWLDIIAVVIIFYILAKRRMGAHDLHPALAPLIEASLGARALR